MGKKKLLKKKLENIFKLKLDISFKIEQIVGDFKIMIEKRFIFVFF